MDGIRRLFQRRPSSAIKSSSDDDRINLSYYNGDRNSTADSSHSFVRDLRAQLATIPNQDADDPEEDALKIQDDFDLSGLKLIKVPTRAHFRAAAASSSSSMDSHKKVVVFSLLIALL